MAKNRGNARLKGHALFSRRAIIMRGAPFSGKSAYANYHFPLELIISSDDIFLSPKDKFIYDYRKEGLSRRTCRVEFVAACQALTPIIVVDDHNLFKSDVDFYTQVCKMYGYDMEIIRCTSIPEISALYNIRGYDLEKCRAMENFIKKQPLYSNETILPAFEYVAGNSQLRKSGKRTLDGIRIRRK